MGQGRPGTLFLKYAIPCANILVRLEKISEEELEELKRASREETEVPRERLEAIFVNAFRRLKEVAEKEGLDYWSEENIRKYFHKYHNDYIDAGDANYSILPETFKKQCKVKKGILKEIVKEGIGRAEIRGELKPVILELINAEVGDEVIIHHSYAVEKA